MVMTDNYLKSRPHIAGTTRSSTQPFDYFRCEAGLPIYLTPVVSPLVLMLRIIRKSVDGSDSSMRCATHRGVSPQHQLLLILFPLNPSVYRFIKDSATRLHPRDGQLTGYESQLQEFLDVLALKINQILVS